MFPKRTAVNEVCYALWYDENSKKLCENKFNNLKKLFKRINLSQAIALPIIIKWYYQIEKV